MNMILGSVSETQVNLGYFGTPTAYPRVAPYGLVDSNSLFANQVFTSGTTWRWLTQFQHITVDHQIAEAQSPAYSSDINDYCTAEVGYEGQDTAIIEKLYQDGTTAQQTITVNISQQVATVPQSLVNIESITKSHDSATINISYPGNDITGYEYSYDGSAANWASTTSPITYTNLSANTLYSGKVRPVNSNGFGSTTAYSFTTDAAPVTAPTEAPTITNIVTTHNTVSIFFSSVAGATNYEYDTNDDNIWGGTNNPLKFTGLSPEMTYTGRIRAFNSAGAGPAVNYSFTTDAAPIYSPTDSSRKLGGNMFHIKDYAAVGHTRGSYNERAIAFWKSQGATADQFNEAQKQYEDNQ